MLHFIYGRTASGKSDLRKVLTVEDIDMLVG